MQFHRLNPSPPDEMGASSEPRDERRADLRLALLAALATAVFHGLLVATLFPFQSQFAKYPWAAAQYLRGALPAEQLGDFSPLYLYVHVLARALLGASDARAEYAVVLLQVFATAASAALLVLLLRRFFSVGLALAGAVAFILTRSVIVYTAVLEPEAFLLLLLLAFLHFSLGAGPRDRLIAGAALALAVATRPSVLPLAAAVPAYFLLNEGRRRWRRPTAVLLAPVLVALTALALRNGFATGSYSPLGMNPGFVFFEGNNPLSSGRSAAYPPLVGELKQEIPDHPDNPHLTYRLLAERAAGRPLSTRQANRYWSEKALAFIADHPGRFFAHVARKAYLLLHAFRSHDLIPAERFDRRLGDRWIPALTFAVVAAMGALGALVSRSRWERLLLVYALLACQVGVMLAMYVSERQRLAALPAFLFFACAGLDFVLRSRGRARWLALGATVGLGSVLLLPNHVMREDRHLWTAYERSDAAWQRSLVLRGQERLADAATAAAQGYAAAPWLRDYARPSGVSFEPEGFAERALEFVQAPEADASGRFDRAQLLIAAGQLDEAAELLQGLIAAGERFDRLFMQPSDPRLYLARVEAARGREGRATELLEEALAHAPGDPFILADLAALTGAEPYRERLARYFGDVDAAFMVGVAQLERGLVEEARVNLGSTVARLPEFWRARIYHAAAVGATGSPVIAAGLYREATATRSDPAALEDRVVAIFAAAAELAPTDAQPKLEYGLVLAQFGRFDEALEALREADALDPRPELGQAIGEVERMRALSTRH